MTVKVDHLTADTLTVILNRLLELDPAAIHEFCERRLPVGDGLDKAAGVVCQDGPSGEAVLGLIGLMQAFYSTLGRRLVAHYDDAGRLIRFAHDAWPADRQGPPFLSAIDVLRAS